MFLNRTRHFGIGRSCKLTDLVRLVLKPVPWEGMGPQKSDLAGITKVVQQHDSGNECAS